MNSDTLENVDWKEQHKFQQENSPLEQICSVSDKDINELSLYERHARYVSRNIDTFGEKVAGGRIIDSKLAEKVCYANSGGCKTDGSYISRTIQLLANDDVSVYKDVRPHVIYYPNETIKEIRKIKREKNKDIRQRMLDSFENEAIAD